MKLKQIQYRSYMAVIEIYHFQAYHISVHDFRSFLNREDHGYVDTLLSDDPMSSIPAPGDDEMSAGCIEVGYLPSVFQHGGSALGFRVGDNLVEWMCFDQPINGLVLNRVDIRDLGGSNGKLMLFDLVATLPKGITERRVKGSNAEHKAWHDSLLRAGHRRVKLGLTWKNYGTELQRQHALQRQEYMKMERAMMPDLDVHDEGSAEEMLVDHENDQGEKGVDSYGLFTSLDRQRYESEADRGGVEDNEDKEEDTVQAPGKHEDEAANKNEKTYPPLSRSSSESTVRGSKSSAYRAVVDISEGTKQAAPERRVQLNDV